MNTEQEKFVLEHPLGSIHQLPQWGKIQTHLKGREKYWILTEKNDGKIIAQALIIKQTLPFNLSWLYTPSSPGVDIFQQIRELAKKENAVFFRFEPPETAEDTTYSKDLLTKIKAHPSHAHYQPESTLIIDLKPSEAEILKQMKPKGRYNIKVAQKHGVSIRKSTPETIEKDTEIFYKLFTQTTTRDRFSGHPLSYYKNMVKTLGPDKCAIFTAQSQRPGSPLASAIITYFKDTATYYYGASSNEHRNTMAPYLLHWQIMQDAKAAGYTHYDLFGIAPEPDPVTSTKNTQNSPHPHPWAGVTDFKLKFGGQRINYFPAQEIIYKPTWYAIIKAVKWLKKAIKRK